MWRFLLPSFFVTLMVFGEAGPSHALPLLPSSATDPALSPPVPGVAGQGDARYAADLRRQANDLQDLVTQVEQQLAHRDPQADVQRRDSELHNELHEVIALLEQQLKLEVQTPPASDVAEQQERHAARDTLNHEIADLQRQDNELQSQLAAHRQELAQSAQEPVRRTHDLDPVQAEANKLRQQRDTEDVRRAIDGLRQAKLSPPPKAQEQQAAVASSRPADPIRLPGQVEPNLPPAQPVLASSTSQRLQSAQQLLSAGRPGEARRVLAMVQTQMIFGPVHQPAAQGGNTSPSDVGDAIRWLDMGASDRAMQSVTRAIDSLDAGG